MEAHNESITADADSEESHDADNQESYDVDFHPTEILLEKAHNEMNEFKTPESVDGNSQETDFDPIETLLEDAVKNESRTLTLTLLESEEI